MNRHLNTIGNRILIDCFGENPEKLDPYLNPASFYKQTFPNIYEQLAECWTALYSDDLSILVQKYGTNNEKFNNWLKYVVSCGLVKQAPNTLLLLKHNIVDGDWALNYLGNLKAVDPYNALCLLLKKKISKRQMRAVITLNPLHIDVPLCLYVMLDKRYCSTKFAEKIFSKIFSISELEKTCLDYPQTRQAAQDRYAFNYLLKAFQRNKLSREFVEKCFANSDNTAAKIKYLIQFKKLINENFDWELLNV